MIFLKSSPDSKLHWWSSQPPSITIGKPVSRSCGPLKALRYLPSTAFWGFLMHCLLSNSDNGKSVSSNFSASWTDPLRSVIKISRLKSLKESMTIEVSDTFTGFIAFEDMTDS